MSEQISSGVVFSVGFDAVKAAASSAQTADVIISTIQQRIANAPVNLDFVKKIEQNLATAVGSGTEKMFEQLERKLASITTSMSRGITSDNIARQLEQWIVLADRLGNSVHRAMGQQTQAVFSAMTSSRPVPASVGVYDSGFAPFGVQSGLPTPSVSGAFGRTGSAGGDNALYQAALQGMVKKQEDVEYDRQKTRRHDQLWQWGLNKNNREAAEADLVTRLAPVRGRTSAVDMMAASKVLRRVEAEEARIRSVKLPQAQDLQPDAFGRGNRTSAVDMMLASKVLQRVQAEEVRIRSIQLQQAPDLPTDAFGRGNRTSAADMILAGRRLRQVQAEEATETARVRSVPLQQLGETQEERRRRVRGAIVTGHHAQQQVEFDEWRDQRFGAFNAMRQMTGQDLVSRQGFNRASDRALDTQRSLMGRQILGNAEAHSAADMALPTRMDRARAAAVTLQNANQQSARDATADQRFAAYNNMRQMSGVGPLDRNLYNMRSDANLDVNRERMGAGILQRANEHAAGDNRRASAQAAYDVFKLNNPTAYSPDGPGARLNRHDSHRLRFATQNLAFGVDDAIQSYHYGGVGASIRAASNNATAIAGMAITNPATAAMSVIGISIAAAIAPALIKAFNGPEKANFDAAKEREIESSSRRSYGSLRSGKGHSLYDKAQEDILSGRREIESLGEDRSNISKDWRSKAREFSGDFTASSTVGKWGHALNWMVGMGPGAELNALDKKKVATVEQEALVRKKIQLAEQQEKEAMLQTDRERKLTVQGEMADRATENKLRQGGFSSGAQYADSIAAKYAAQGALISSSTLSKDEKRFRLGRLNMERDDELANKERLDLTVTEANRNRQKDLHSQQERHNAALYRFSGDNGRVGQLSNQNDVYQSEQVERRNSLLHSYRTGAISAKDHYLSSRQLGVENAANTANFSRQRRRAVEDDLEDLNPERNPLTRQERQLTRLKEDIALRQGLSPEEKANQMRAGLTAADRRREETLHGGQRRFMSQSEVGSAEDSEMRARMVGNFGPTEKREDYMKMSLDQLTAAFDRLAAQLHIEAQSLERN